MELILFICSREACRYYRVASGMLMPQKLQLPNSYFRIKDSLELSILERDAYWHFSNDPNRNYQIFYDGHPVSLQSIQDQTVFQIRTIHKESLCILAFTDVNICRAYKHYSIVDQTQIPLGKQSSDTIQYQIHNLISNLHTKIYYVNHDWKVYDVGKNGTYLNCRRIKKHETLKFGDIIDVYGLRIVYLEQEIAVFAYGENMSVKDTMSIVCRQDTTDEEPTLLQRNRMFHRAPRVVLLPDKELIELDAPPSMREAHKQPLILTIGPAFTMAVPMILGFVVTSYSIRKGGQTNGYYLYTGLVTAIASALLGTLWAIMNVKNQKKQYLESEYLRKSAYIKYIDQQELRIKKRYEEHTNALYSMYPSAREVCRYGADTHVLWNRNISHNDFLSHRIGLGEAVFQTEIRIPKDQFEVCEDELRKLPHRLTQKYHMLHNVPVCIDFDENRLVGIIEENGGSDVICLLTVQFAAHHSYTDVKLVYLLEGRYGKENIDRGFVRWLPHVWSEDKKVRYVDFGEGHSEELIYEFCQTMRQRLEISREDTDRSGKLPHYVIMIEHYKRLEDILPLQYLFSMQRECGITTILIADKYEGLPNECSYILQKNKNFTGVYNVDEGETKRKKICMDIVISQEAEALARRLSSIETTEPKISARLPEVLTLCELLDIKNVEELDIETIWRESRPDLYLKAPIGMKASGSICYLDVHEKAHGPHGLIAGMTGSGKSELLQTYIIAMAVRYRPEEVGFFLIDYKGGGMANLFLRLPHLIGCISNLSGAMVHRAMVSIKSENKRRQSIFNQYHISSIHEYLRLFRTGEAIQPLPHIMIIIDEFAELKREEPDFMKELISVAQVGRSLGIHLILATQKPAGTVDDNIRSNARFRLCLRVQDRQDSTDMLHKADAAYITQAGRAYFQVGNDELYELFQGGWSGAVYQEEHDDHQNAAVLFTISGREEYGGYHQRNHSQTEKADEDNFARTQLEAVIDRICTVYEGIEKQKVAKLWLPMLPRQLCLSELDVIEEDTKVLRQTGEDICVAIGRYDHPRQQLQGTFYVKLTEGGHHMICGMVTSGKSTFLQTLLYALVTKYSPAQVHLYIIDCSSHFLVPFQQIPHTGGFMGENDIGEIKKTIHLLHTILEERKGLLKGGNFRQYIKSVEVLPSIILVIDNYAIFRERTDGCFETDLMEFSRIGEGYGIYLVVTAAGIGAGDLSARMAENFRTVICLRMTDRYQYAGILRIPRVEVCPENDIYGRGLAWVEGELLEFQTALAVAQPDDYARLEQINKVCMDLNRRLGKNNQAKRIPCIPEPLSRERMIQESLLRDDREQLAIGYFTETAERCVFDFGRWYCMTICGRRNSGMTELLQIIIETEAMRETAVYIIDTQDQTLKHYHEGEEWNIAGYYVEAEGLYGFYEELGETFKIRSQRKSILKKAGEAHDEIYRTMCQDQRILIVIKDLCLWTNEHYVNHVLKNAEALLFNLLEKGECNNIYFVAAYSGEDYATAAGRRIFEQFTGYRTGIHMGGNVIEERILDFSYVSYSEQNRSLKQGYGMIPNMESRPCNGKGQMIIPIS